MIVSFAIIYSVYMLYLLHSCKISVNMLAGGDWSTHMDNHLCLLSTNRGKTVTYETAYVAEIMKLETDS